MLLVLYTTAPEILDGTETRPGRHEGFTGEGVPVRSVEIGLAAGVAQVQRYLDSGAVVWTEDEWELAVKHRLAYADGAPVPRTHRALL